MQTLQTPGTVAYSFKQLDANRDGVVTFNDILNYSGTGSSSLKDFLTFIGREMHPSAGGEKTEHH